MHEREGLIARIRQIRRVSAASEPSSARDGELTDLARSQALDARVAHLEDLLQGLQDSVYRESQRTDRRIADLEARTEPATLAAELSRDARERGL